MSIVAVRVWLLLQQCSYVCEECQLRDAIITDAQVTESSGQLVSSQLTALRICYSISWREHGMFAAANCQLYSIEKQESVADFPLSRRLPANIWVSFPVDGQIKMYCMLLCTVLFCVRSDRNVCSHAVSQRHAEHAILDHVRFANRI